MKNKVFIATSIDGYIADENGAIDWLHSFSNPENIDMGYNSFMSEIDAVVMGRNTFETVCGFDMEWPYTIKVFVLSNTLQNIPDKFSNKVELLKGDLVSILEKIHKQGYYNLYIDGGNTIHRFLNEDLIDEMIITTIPIVLGNGISLFGKLPRRLNFACVQTEIFLNAIVQNKFLRKR